MVNKSNIGELTIEQKDFKVTIKQKEDHVAQVISAPAQVAYAHALPAAAPHQPARGAELVEGDNRGDVMFLTGPEHISVMFQDSQ